MSVLFFCLVMETFVCVFVILLYDMSEDVTNQIRVMKMMQVLTFGQALANIMRKYSLTPAKLAARLCMPNAVTISRILRDETSQQRREELYRLIAAHMNSLLCRDEIAALEQALEVSRIGKTHYRAHKDMEALLFGGHDATADPMIAELGVPLSQFLQRFSDDEPLQLLCFNCCRSALGDHLSRLFEQPRRLIELWHYISIDNEERNPALLLRFASRFASDHRYHPRVFSYEANGADSYFFAPDMLFYRYGFGPNADEGVLMLHSTGINAMNLAVPGFFDQLARAIDHFGATPSVFFSSLTRRDSEDALSTLHSIYDQGRTKCIYQLKNAPGFDLFQPEWLMQLYREAGVSPVLHAADQQVLFNVFETRNRCLLKECPHAHFTFSLDGLEQLAHSGRCDHIRAALRPLHPHETAMLIDVLLDKQLNDPTFELHLLKRGMDASNFSVTCFEDHGMLITAREPSAGDPYPLFVEESILQKQFINFYHNEILSRAIIDDADVVPILRQLKDKLTADVRS